MFKVKISPLHDYDGKIYYCAMTKYTIIIGKYSPLDGGRYDCLHIRPDGTTNPSEVSIENLIRNIDTKHWIPIN